MLRLFSILFAATFLNIVTSPRVYTVWQSTKNTLVTSKRNYNWIEPTLTTTEYQSAKMYTGQVPCYYYSTSSEKETKWKLGKASYVQVFGETT